MPQEGGLRKHRIEFVREDEMGVTPVDPDWGLFSDNVRQINWNPDANIEPQRGIGNPDPKGHHASVETHNVDLTYDLQRFLVDDPAYDGLARDEDNELPNSHTLVDREKHHKGGAAGAGFHTYTVGTGGKIGDVSIEGEPDSSQPIPITLNYQFEKVRPYKIDQPAGATLLTIKSNNQEDVGQELTIEDEGANTSETIEINGETEVTTTSEFESIDVSYLSQECQGDLTIEDSDGNLLMTINGKETYDGVEGDLGVPPLGVGSHAEELGTDYEYFLGDEIERNEEEFAFDISSVSLSVANNLDTTPRHNSKKWRINETNRETQLSATVYGEAASHDRILEHLQTVAKDITWKLTSTIVKIKKAVLVDGPSRDIEEGQAVMSLDNNFSGEGLEIEKRN
ncbi:hypothetical protein [Natroniella sp. ANB-PHB2]|uniref:hypothetical protein n=1 Tax=Natroniella sp. ANB-PHB2 TaxID=3384444 RepID=UPI0038D38D9C